MNTLRELQHTVLLHLTENGPAKWGAVYGRFDDDRTGAVGLAMELLAQLKHILVEEDGTAKVTALGIEQLQRPSA